MQKKILSIVLMVAFIATFFSGCQIGKRAQADESGNMLSLTFDTIYAEGRQGIFVMNKDGTYSPVLENVPGYQGAAGSSSPKRFIWYVDSEETNYTELIPIATPETPLVCIYRSNAALPANWYLEEYKDKGYTLGAHFRTTEKGELFLDVNEPFEGTNAQGQIALAQTPDEEYSVLSVNGSETLPVRNIDPNMNLMLGLEKNKMYTFAYFVGTIPSEISMFSDMRVLQSSEYTSLTAPVKKTSNGYFIVNLPANLKSGYYYICDIGLFEYRAGEVKEKTNEEPSETVVNEESSSNAKDETPSNVTNKEETPEEEPKQDEKEASLAKSEEKEVTDSE